jgi:hypothetical protein
MLKAAISEMGPTHSQWVIQEYRELLPHSAKSCHGSVQQTLGFSYHKASQTSKSEDCEEWYT